MKELEDLRAVLKSWERLLQIFEQTSADINEVLEEIKRIKGSQNDDSEKQDL